MKTYLKPLSVLLTVFSILYVILQFYNNNISSDIDKNRFVTVAEVYQISFGARNISLDYRFHHKGKTYNQGKPVNEVPKTNVVDRFFEVHLSEKNPEHNILFLDRPITDSTIIENAGFSFTDTQRTNQFQEQ